MTHRDELSTVDMFSGIGGSSQGIEQAGLNVKAAANHNKWALGVHEANHPDTEHFRADLVDDEADDYVHPAQLPDADILWASPECTNHSAAKANKIYQAARQQALFDYAEVIDAPDEHRDRKLEDQERSRVTMECVYAYAWHHRPKYIVVENVVEVCKWGPGRDGSQYRSWVTRIKRMGYEHRPLFLNSGFFGVPQSRDRYYGVFWRKDMPTPDLDHQPDAFCKWCDRVGPAFQAWKPRKPTWPIPQWGKYSSQYTYNCCDCGKPAEPLIAPSGAIIDWDDLGPTVGERFENGEPLVDKTLQRIRRVLAKFWSYPPVLIDGTNAHLVLGGSPEAQLATIQSFRGRNSDTPAGRHVSELCPTESTKPSSALLTLAGTAPFAGHTHPRPGQVRARHAAENLFTIAGTNQHAVVSLPAIATLRGGGSFEVGGDPVTDLMTTVSAGGFHHALVSAGWTKWNGGPTDTAPHPVSDLFGTFTSIDTTRLVSAGTLPLVYGGSDDSRGRHAAALLATLTASRERYLVTSADQVDPNDITEEQVMAARFRMLKTDTETRRGSGVSEDFIIEGTTRQKQAGFGNMVTPPVAQWIASRISEAYGGR